MNKRFASAAGMIFFSLIGGFSSFFIARSQVQFASINYLFFALAALCAGVGLIISERPDQDERGLSGVSMLGYVCMVWAVLSCSVSGRFATTILGMPTSLLGLGTLVCLALVALFAYRARFEVLTILGYSAPVLLLATGLYGVFAQPALDANGKTLDALHLGFANSSELALFYVMLVPFVLMRGYQYFKNDLASRIARYLVVVVVLVATLVNAMRMAMLVILLIALYYLVCEFVPLRAVRRKIVAAVGGLGFFAGVLFVGQAMAGKMGASFLSIRGQLWRMAAEEITKRPIFGYGADGFFGASATINKPARWWGGSPLHLTDGTTDPHNILVMIAVSFGLMGLVLALALIVVWMRRALKAQASLEDEQLSQHSQTSKKSKKKEAVAAPERGYFSAPMVASLAALFTLLTMPTTVNLLPLLALCLGSALLPTPQQKCIPYEQGNKAYNIVGCVGLTLALCFTIVTGANVVARISLGGVTYLQGPDFEKAYSLNRFFGWDPFISHELNTAFVYSESTGAQAASELARMVSLKSERPTLADPTNPYYRLMYINVLYRAGRVVSPLWGRSADTPSDLRLALLKAASKDFPRQPDIDIELADSALQAHEPALARQALKTVTDLGEYGKQVWAVPLQSIEKALKTETQTVQ